MLVRSGRFALVVLALVCVAGPASAVPPDPSTTSATFGSAPTTNQPITAVIVVRDSDGIPINRGGTFFQVEIAGPGTASEAVISDNNDGTHHVEFLVDRVGTYQVSVTLAGDPEYTGAPAQIAGSPYTLFVNGPDAAHSTATGDGVEVAARHDPATFVIQARDAAGALITSGGDPFVVSVQTPGKRPWPFIFVDNDDGTYTVMYVPDKPGAWRVRITLFGVDIAGSPFRPLVLP